jgi:hypothetical protein
MARGSVVAAIDRSINVVSGKKRFWIGFLGGLTPYALSFTTFCVTSLTVESVQGLFVLLEGTIIIPATFAFGWIIGVFGLSVIQGGFSLD